jgi:hypothetical protein
MPKFMCKRTTVADRLYEEGKIYELTEAPNKHFEELMSPKAEIEKGRGRPPKGTPPGGEPPKAGKKDDSTLKFME